MLSLDLEKKVETFTLSLEKAGVFKIPVLEARFAVDMSASMIDEFANGLVDRTIDLFIAAALKFDDNGSLDVGFFNSTFHKTAPATAADAGQYLKKSGQRANGGTNYAPIIENFETTTKGGFWAGITGKKAKHRGYAAIITDGDNYDESAFEAALQKTSGDTFFQFIGIGTQVSKRYLKSVADRYPHVSFFIIERPNKVTDEEFYEMLCNDKLTKWINAA